jgi:putative membrane protein
MKFDDACFQQLAMAIDHAEQKTSVEIVVSVVGKSGSYRDVDLMTGVGLAFAGLLFVVYNPWTVHSPTLFPLKIAVLFVVGFLGSRACPAWRRLLTSTSRREQQVQTAAQAHFVQAGVAGTRKRTGLLIYLSLLERQTEVIADIGIPRAIDPEVWNPIQFQLREIAASEDPAGRLLQEVAQLGSSLGEFLPATEDNPDELPNAPHVELDAR